MRGEGRQASSKRRSVGCSVHPTRHGWVCPCWSLAAEDASSINPSMGVGRRLYIMYMLLVMRKVTRVDRVEMPTTASKHIPGQRGEGVLDWETALSLALDSHSSLLLPDYLASVVTSRTDTRVRCYCVKQYLDPLSTVQCIYCKEEGLLDSYSRYLWFRFTGGHHYIQLLL